MAGLPVGAVVQLYNSSTVPQKRRLELFIDGKLRETSPEIEIPAGAIARHSFQFSFASGGLHRGEARLAGDDGCPLDDRRWFAAQIDRGIPVAVVTGRRHEIDYLDDSFKSPEDIETETGLSVIGIVPRPKPGTTVEEELADPRSGMAEAFRSLRTGLQFSTSEGLPKSLSQILEVVYEMEVNGYTRTQATNRVAKKRGTAPQTITDKYCRQLGKRAHEIDELLTEPGYSGFKDLLTSKFAAHRGIIDMYFDSMMSDSDDANFVASEIEEMEIFSEE